MPTLTGDVTIPFYFWGFCQFRSKEHLEKVSKCGPINSKNSSKIWQLVCLTVMQNVVRKEGGSEYALYMDKEDNSHRPKRPLKKEQKQAAPRGPEAGGAGRRVPVHGADRPPASGPITSLLVPPKRFPGISSLVERRRRGL